MVQGVSRAGGYRLIAVGRVGHGPLPAKVFAFHVLTVVVAGLCQAVATAWPVASVFQEGYPVWWMQCLALALLVWRVNGCVNPRQVFFSSLLFATVWLSATFWWLYVALHTYGGLHSLLAVAAVGALAAALGAYYALACVLYWRLSRVRPHVASLLFAMFWTMAEMARGTWLTGFGWGAVGYAHVDGPLASYAPWLGVYGVGAIAAFLAASAANVNASGWWERASGVAMLSIGFAVGWAAPAWTIPSGTLSVSLLQGNIPQNEKFQAGSGVPFALRWYREQLFAAKGDLVVAPETAIPVLPQQLPPEYFAGLMERYTQGGQAALIGSPWGSSAQGYTNAILGVRPNQSTAWRYDKHHLVPFGEFIPPMFQWFITLMDIPLGEFSRGGIGQDSLEWKGQRLAPNICYEDLFGEELGARFVDSRTAPTVFVNVSNIAWFGNTIAIDQHLQISRMRALEFQVPMIRATNTGPTVIIDHAGHVTAALERHTRGVLNGSVQGRTGITPFAWWVARFGLWPLWLCALAVVWVACRPAHAKVRATDD